MDNAKLMGFVTPGDQKVPVTVRVWDATRLALWRSKRSWEIAQKEATSILTRCAHMEGCEAKTIETASCLSDCPDRELRMSALVILNAARQFSPLDARRLAEGPYFAPSREHFSEVIAELIACQATIEALDPDGSLRALKVASTTDPAVATVAAQQPLQEKTP